jgi:UDP-glucose 4-epimerase
MRALVTGGAGFIGTNLVNRLVDEGHEVTILDDLSAHNPLFCQDRLVHGSVTDSALVNELTKHTDIIFHLAVRTMAISTIDPRSDLRVSIEGTLNILLAAQQYNVPVVYTSSSAVYGNGKPPFKENDPIDLLTPYAAGKYAAEGYCRALYNVRVATVRLSNVYGPYQSPMNPYCGVVAKFMDRAGRKMPLAIFGNGEQTRDFTYVADAVEAIMLALRLALRLTQDATQDAAAQKGFGQVINVGTGIETSIKRLAEIVGEMFGSEQIEYTDRRDIDLIGRRMLDCSRAAQVLGWQAKTDLAAGLELTRRWMEAS